MIIKLLRMVLRKIAGYLIRGALKTLRWVDHILRFKFAMIPTTATFIGWYMATERGPHINDLQLWLGLASVFFLAEAALIDNQYNDFERDRNNPQKWGQPPKIVYILLRCSFTVIGTIIITILYYTGDRKPRTALAILMMILPTLGFA